MPDGQQQIQFTHRRGLGFVEQGKPGIVRLRFEDIPPHQVFAPLGEDERTGMIVFVDLTRAHAQLLGRALLQGQPNDPE